MPDEYIIGSAGVSIVPDARGFTEKLDAQLRDIGKLIGTKIGHQIGQHLEQAAKPYIEKLKSDIDSLSGKNVWIGVETDDAKIEATKAKIDALRGKTIELAMAFDDAELTKVKAQIAELESKHPDVKISAETAEANAKIDALEAKVAALTDRVHELKVRADDGGSSNGVLAKLGALGSGAAAAGAQAVMMSAKFAIIGSVVTAAVGAALPALAALGAGAAGVLAMGVVGKMGLSGVGAAISAAGNPSMSGGGVAGRAAMSAIQQQQQQISAAQAVQSAQDNLTSAIHTQEQAEINLHNARKQALWDLQNLKNAVADNALSQQQASLNLVKARQTLAQDMAGAGSAQSQYRLQIEQDQLNVALAQQSVKDNSTQGGQLKSKLVTAQAQGVNNNPNVLAAQQALIDANHKLAEAQQQVVTTARSNALAAASLAQQNANAAMGANAFGNAMSKLNPIQRQFVDFYLSTMKPVLNEWKLAASGFLPGLEKGFNDARPAFGGIQKLIGSIAHAMGTMFDQFGKGLASPAGQKAIATLTQILPAAINMIAPLLMGVGSLMIKVFSQLGPLVTSLMPAFHALGAVFAAIGHLILEVLTKMAPAIAPLLNALAAGLTSIAPMIASLLTAVAQGLTPILPALAGLIAAMAPFLQQLLTGLAPILPVIGTALIGLLRALSPLLPVIGQLAHALIPLLNAVFQAIASTISLNAQVLADLVIAIIPTIPAFTQLVQACAPLVAQLGKHLLPILPPLAKLLIQLGNAFLPMIQIILPLFLKILDFTVAKIIGPVASALTFITNQVGNLSGVFSDAVRWIGRLPTAIGNLASSMFTAGKNLITRLWDGIKSVVGDAGGFAKGLVNAIILGIDNLLHLPLKIPTIPLPFGGSVGGETLIPYIKPMAKGGWVDSALIMAGEAGREYVLTSGMLTGHAPVDQGVAAAVMKNQQITAPAASAAYDKFSRQSGMTMNNTFNIRGQSDPVATAHQVANRLAMRSY